MTPLQYGAVYGTVFVLVAATIIYLIAVSAMLSKLRRNHVATFRDLGEPSLFTNNTMSNGARVVRFVFSREYKNLNDPDIDRIAGTCRALLIGIPVLLGCALIFAFAYGSMGGA